MSSADEITDRRARLSNAALPIQKQSDTGRKRDAAAADRAAAAEDRRLAAADRRRAAQYLADAYRDEVTDALNRRPGREQMHAEVDRAHRTSAPLAVIFFDIDRLKQVNDTYGHARGDELLAAAGTALRASLRSYDVIVRYGGDEFVCALPGGTEATASASIDRTRRTLAGLMPGATLSAGHAQLQAGDTLDDVIRRADADLYRRRSETVDRFNGARSRHVVDATDHRPLHPFEPSLACGGCGERIPLTEFALQDDTVAVRSADCAACGETTLIHLARVKS
jgi:diguanylate cyclase (GGDEF)-like protein